MIVKFLLGLFMVPTLAIAAPIFDDITDEDMKDIAGGFGANFAHNSLMGASKLGTIFGFQVGLTAAQTNVKKIGEIVEREGGSKLDSIYNAGLMASVGIPFGISFEAVVIPTMKADGTKISATSGAIKMNINEVIPILPVNLAIRGIASTAELSFDQSGGKIKNETTITGAQLLFSPMIPLVEPYVGIGLLNSENKLSATIAGIFDPAYSVADSKSKSVSGTQILAGVEVNLLLIKLGVEYSSAFGNDRVGAKLSIGF